MNQVESSQPAFQGLHPLAHLALHPQLLLGPSMNLSSKQVGLPYFLSVSLFLCPNLSLSISSFSLLRPIFTYPSRVRTSPLPQCLSTDTWLWALDSDHLGLESPLCYLLVVELTFLASDFCLKGGWHILPCGWKDSVRWNVEHAGWLVVSVNERWPLLPSSRSSCHVSTSWSTNGSAVQFIIIYLFMSNCRD